METTHQIQPFSYRVCVQVVEKYCLADSEVLIVKCRLFSFQDTSVLINTRLHIHTACLFH